jgi:hypothetical protein
MNLCFDDSFFNFKFWIILTSIILLSNPTSKVILSILNIWLTNNENYIDFWNYISKFYKNKFDVIPTLFFVGNHDEYNSLLNSRISTENGEIYHLPRVSDINYESNLDWTCTWGLFYGASKFSNEICMLSGIDQIPMNDSFFSRIKQINSREKYIVGFADAYNPPIFNCFGDEIVPSSHHVGLGINYKIIYEIEDSWESELKKVYQYKNLCISNDCWGLDELYSSHKIKNHIKSQKNPQIHFMNGFFKSFSSGRLSRTDRSFDLKNYSIEDLKNGKYSEYHASRPFCTNYGLETLYEIIPKFNNTY